MLLLSAQPDDYYFLWQLELQLYNFHQLGILAEDIQVLIGYNPTRGLSKEFQNMMNKNTYATFFAYPDNRETNNYPSSIRPHIIKQHVAAYPSLEDAAIFYHDSDIILRELPEFGNMKGGEIWYVADTRSYLNVNYIKSSGSENLFKEMCTIVRIPPEIIIANDENAGGAQYFFKNTSYKFWNKVEKDCESIYRLLCDYNNIEGEKYYLETGNPISKYHGIQAWTADMWAVLWNAWLSGFKVRIHAELDFCWPNNNLQEWQQKKILHYAGGVNVKENEKMFCKTRYVHYPPYYDDLSKIDKTTCSYILTQLIQDYLREQSKDRIDLKDVTFLIPVRIDSEERLENLSIILKYLNKYFITNIFIAESDEIPKVRQLTLPDNCNHIFYQDNEPAFHRTKYNNLMAMESNTPIIAIYDTDVVFSINQIMKAVNMIRNGYSDYVSPYSGAFVYVDRMFKTMFGKLLDPDLLTYNIGKFTTGTYRSWGGAAFLNKPAFLAAGMDNKKIDSWGPEDIERMKRMQILGFTIKRVTGPLFHLPHPLSHNSRYQNLNIRIRLMEEFLKVCSLKKEELKEYVMTWN